MWKSITCFSNFFNLGFNQKIIYTLNLDDYVYQSLLIGVSIRPIYQFIKDMMMCIKQIKNKMYNSQKKSILLSKNLIIKNNYVKIIHIILNLITIYRGKNYLLYT